MSPARRLGQSRVVGDIWNGPTVLLLPGHEGVVPFCPGELADIAQDGIGWGTRRIAGVVSPRTVDSVEKACDEEGNTEEGKMRGVNALLHCEAEEVWRGNGAITRTGLLFNKY